MLAAPEGALDFGVFQWLVGLGVLAAGTMTGLFVSKALNGRALSQLEANAKETDAHDLPSRTKALEGTIKELKAANLSTRMRDVERTSKETETWRQEATQQLETIEKERFADAAVKEALRASSSTTSGTIT